LNLVFSSFGFFMGPVTLLLFALEIYLAFRAKKTKEILVGSLSFAAALATIGLFFIGYNTSYIGTHVTFLTNTPWQYLFYISLAYAGVFGIKGIGVLQLGAGFFILLLVIWVFAQSIARLLRPKQNPSGDGQILSRLLMVLTMYSLLFSVNLAFGRIEFGLLLAQSSRYIPYLIPSLIGVYFYFNSLTMSKKALIIPALFVVMLFSQYISRNSLNDMRIWHDRKALWKTEYLKFEDANLADSASHFTVYPNNEQLKGRLQYLKTHNLNLYKNPK
jgi:hypothetical protein